MRERIDLHIHSNHSDGLFSPQKIVYIASRNYVRAISITDHDNISATNEVRTYGEKMGVEVIPGLELSAQQDGRDTHFLGYYIDENSAKLLEYLNFFKDERVKRAKKILSILEQIGILIDFEEVLEKSANGSLGRPHIADVLIEKGFVQNRVEAFNQYLGNGAVAFVPQYRLSSKDAIQLINSAGGISVVAHTGLEFIEDYLPQWVDEYGLKGLEVIHPRFSAYQTFHLQRLAKKFKLVVTGGSDCHGDRNNGEGIIGNFYVPYHYLIQLKKCAGIEEPLLKTNNQTKKS
ncbi:PHP domain-containing protein [candidate division KSB1 bacterium]|nr:PHP domain-containing protein [candidate division KSB1 bacterium]